MVRMTCAIALLLVGFAHQAPSFAKNALAPAEFAEYVLPDGTLPVICVAGKAGGMHKHEKAQMHGCDACRIGASVLLPVPEDSGTKHIWPLTAARQVWDTEISPRRILPPNTGPRAPPRNWAFA
jgi:hypothetical protein